MLGRRPSLADAAFLALQWGLPHRAQGVAVCERKLLAVHREAMKVAGRPQSRLWRRLRDEADPVRRVALALASTPDEMSRIDLSQFVTDAWAGLTVPERYVFSRNLLAALGEDRLTAATYELLLEPAAKVLAFSREQEHQMTIPRGRAAEWDRVLAAVTRLQREGSADASALGNTLYTLFVVEEQVFDPSEVIAKDREWAALFRPPVKRAAA